MASLSPGPKNLSTRGSASLGSAGLKIRTQSNIICGTSRAQLARSPSTAKEILSPALLLAALVANFPDGSAIPHSSVAAVTLTPEEAVSPAHVMAEESG